MASDTYVFRGVGNWVKVKTPDAKFQVYTLDLHLDKPSMDLFKSSGLQLELRDSDKDGQFIKVRRPVSKKVKGELVDMGPPTVLIKRGDNYEPFNELIGNGSTLLVKVRVYDTPRGKGHELDTVAVETLVPYAGGENFTPEGVGELPF
jgi:hypothetical protein